MGANDQYKQRGYKLSQLKVIYYGDVFQIMGSFSTEGDKKMLNLSTLDGHPHIDLPYDFNFSLIFVAKLKSLLFFNTLVQKVGKYNDSEKGGWYTKKDLYKYKGEYYYK